jgi:ABC-2 type transport system permease protein
MKTFQFLTNMSSLSWKMQRNEFPLSVFLSTFAIRIIFQVLFFVWIAKVIGGEEWMNFALYGNIILPALAFLFIDVYNVIREEIDENRLEMLICTPSSLLSILIGRTLGYILKAFLVIIFTYIIVGTILISDPNHWYSFLTALPVILIIATSGYSLAVFMAAFSLSERISHILPNVMVMVLMLLGNITIPITSLPSFLQTVSSVIPLRHGVDAFRSYMVNQIPYWTNIDFYIEIVYLLTYSILGYTIYLYSIKKSRREPINL